LRVLALFDNWGEVTCFFGNCAALLLCWGFGTVDYAQKNHKTLLLRLNLLQPKDENSCCAGH